MERTSVKKDKILSEANRLVSSGLRKAAIDLLLEYLETDPDSSIILSTLGRIYLLDHQTEKAVIYLKRSLAITQGINSDTKPTSKYQADSFSDDDMAYVDSQADTSSEEEYQLDTDPADSGGRNKEQILYSAIPLSEPTSDGKERVFHEQTGNGTVPRHDSQLSAIDKHGTIDPNPEILKGQPDAININNPVYPKARDDKQIEEDENELAIGNHGDLSWVDVEDPVSGENRDLFADELVEYDIDEEGQDEDISDDLESLIYNSSIEEESDELNWGDFEDLNEFDELANRGAEDNVEDEEKISREERARQIAVLVLDESGWIQSTYPCCKKYFLKTAGLLLEQPSRKR